MRRADLYKLREGDVVWQVTPISPDARDRISPVGRHRPLYFRRLTLLDNDPCFVRASFSTSPGWRVHLSTVLHFHARGLHELCSTRAQADRGHCPHDPAPCNEKARFMPRLRKLWERRRLEAAMEHRPDLLTTGEDR